MAACKVCTTKSYVGIWLMSRNVEEGNNVPWVR